MGIVKMVWDAQQRKYVPEGEQMEPKEQSLTDIGTRYQHLVDLRDVWQEGIEAVSRRLPAHRTSGDEDLLKSLHVCISLINKQLGIMSGYDKKKFDLRREVNSIPLDPNQIPTETPKDDNEGIDALG